MTYDKAVHYINNPRIVQAIKQADEPRLKAWLVSLNEELEFRYPKGEGAYPIRYVAEKYLIEARLRK